MSNAEASSPTLVQLAVRFIVVTFLLITSLSWFAVLGGLSLTVPVGLSLIALLLLFLGSKID